MDNPNKKPPYGKWLLWAAIGIIALVALMMTMNQ